MSNEISLVMGSSSDWSTMKEAANILDEFGVKYDKAVISAHRMPQEMFEFAQGAVSAGVKVIIAGAGGAAHLPGMIAANTVLPVIGVPVQSHALSGMIVDRANAGRRTCCYDGNRCFRRQERCFVGFGNSRNHKSENSA